MENPNWHKRHLSNWQIDKEDLWEPRRAGRQNENPVENLRGIENGERCGDIRMEAKRKVLEAIVSKSRPQPQALKPIGRARPC